jgi:hypothetical protein
MASRRPLYVTVPERDYLKGLRTRTDDAASDVAALDTRVSLIETALGTTQLISGTGNQTVNAGVTHVYLDGAGATNLLLPKFTVGKELHITQRSLTSRTRVTVTPEATDAMLGRAAGAAVVMLGSAQPAFSGYPRPAWIVRCGELGKLEAIRATPDLLGLLPTGGTGVVGAWDWDGNLTGGVNSYNLTALGTTQYVTDEPKNNGALFVNAGGYSSNGALLNRTGDITIEMHVQGLRATGAVQRLFQHDIATRRRYYAGVAADGYVFWGYDNAAAGAQTDVVGPVLNPFRRYMLHFVRRASGADQILEIWLNHNLNTTQTKVSSSPHNGGVDTTLYIGQRSDATERLGATAAPVLMSQLRVHNSALSASEIEARCAAVGLYYP